MAFGKGYANLTKAEKEARRTQRIELQKLLPPMNEGLGRPPNEAKDTTPGKTGRKNKTRGKQALSIVGDVNQAALERIAHDFKIHPTKKTPLEVMIDVASNVNNKDSLRLAAAEKAAPYLHKKMASFVDDQATSSGTAPPIINIVEVKNDNAQVRADLEAELDAAIKNAGKTRTE